MTATQIQFFESTGQTAILLDHLAGAITRDRYHWLSLLLSLLPSDMVGPFRVTVRVQSPPSDDPFPAFDPRAGNKLRLVLQGTTDATQWMVWDRWWADVVMEVLNRLIPAEDATTATGLFVQHAEDRPPVFRILHHACGVHAGGVEDIKAAVFVQHLSRYLEEQVAGMIDSKLHFGRAVERVFGITPEVKSCGGVHTVNIRTKPQMVCGCRGWLELRLSLHQGKTLFPIIAYRTDHPRAGELPCSQQRRVLVDPSLPPQEGVEMALYEFLKNAHELMGLISGLSALMGVGVPTWEADASPAMPEQAFAKGFLKDD